MRRFIKTRFLNFLNESSVSQKTWYHGSDKPVNKFLFSLIGVNSERITNYHGYGIYFIDNIERAKKYGNVITSVEIDSNSDFLIDKVTPTQLLKIYNRLKVENVKLRDSDVTFYKNQTYGEYSVLNDIEEFYGIFIRFYRDNFKNNKDVTEFLLRGGIDGMKVTNDVGDNILVVFNEKIINIIKPNISNFLTEKSNTKKNLNSNFWKWFGDSNIKNDDNQPIILYHGSKTEFTSFNYRKKGSSTDPGIRGRGFYFTSNIKTAQSYGDNIYEVYLKIERPFDLLSFNSLDEIINLLGIDSTIIKERGRGSNYHSISIHPDFSGIFSGAVRELGYDGIIHGQEYICFNPNQIKSIDNDGTWDSIDDNIFS